MVFWGWALGGETGWRHIESFFPDEWWHSVTVKMCSSGAIVLCTSLSNIFFNFSQISRKCNLNPTAFLCNSDRNNNLWDINMDVSETGIEDSLDEMCSCVTLSAAWTCINLLWKRPLNKHKRCQKGLYRVRIEISPQSGLLSVIPS